MAVVLRVATGGLALLLFSSFLPGGRHRDQLCVLLHRVADPVPIFLNFPPFFFVFCRSYGTPLHKLVAPTPMRQAFQLPASVDAIFQVWPFYLVVGREIAAGRVRTCARKAHSPARGETPGWRWDSSAPEASEGGPCVCVTCEVEVSLTIRSLHTSHHALRSRQGQPCRPTRTASSGHAPATSFLCSCISRAYTCPTSCSATRPCPLPSCQTADASPASLPFRAPACLL